MLLRGRSRDRGSISTHPGPVYMSNDEFSEYLRNLRYNRVERPRGARPLSLNTRSEDARKEYPDSLRESLQANSISSTPNATQRPNSAFSHKRAQSSLSTTYSSVKSHTGSQTPQYNPENSQIPLLKPSDVVPSATYIERGQRWMEKEEAVALRKAMEDMNIDEESRIYAAAQKEASELVWQHQNPNLVEKPGQPYRYKNHLRKNSYQHARSESVSRYSGASQVTGLARDIPGTLRSASRCSNSSEALTTNGHILAGASDLIGNHHKDQDLKADVKNQILNKFVKDGEPRSSMRKINRNALNGSRSPITSRRNSGRRNVSGELITGPFGGDQIWEEPEQDNIERGRTQAPRELPAPLRIKDKNPINRVQFAQDSEQRTSGTLPESTKRRSIFEIHKNPPSQNRNPQYIANVLPTANSENDSSKVQKSQVPIRDGIEIRSDEIRQATSMRLKDRSPKLPVPSIVSDKPGRPIVSFDPNWKPKKADLKSETRGFSPDRINQCQSLPNTSVQTISSTAPSVNLCSNRSSSKVSSSKVTTILEKNTNSSSKKPSPTSDISYSVPSVPTIVHSKSPPVSLTSTSLPTINIETSEPKTKRPLPVPSASSKKISNSPSNPLPQSHWSLVPGRRPTVTCHLCQLPIQNRVLKIGTDEIFHPECFCCSTCGTGLESLEIYPEPPSLRAERIDRIRRREKGEDLPEIEGKTKIDDGDERNRYYCHLDFHENFAPKCKHCKTPIIGEHIIALGEHWHYGHFFCAECGNPFEKDMTHIHIDGYAWCINCQTKRLERRAPKCKSCQKAVIGEYVRALGGEWHEQCFRCDVCEKGFDDGSFYPKQVNPSKTIVLCTHCIERELKA
ncbi:hypothetical protein HI914_05753 [Erysiphe necator]|nr:hypothetical protein HI914_05753 [Erysiphe necator]